MMVDQSHVQIRVHVKRAHGYVALRRQRVNELLVALSIRQHVSRKTEDDWVPAQRLISPHCQSSNVSAKPHLDGRDQVLVERERTAASISKPHPLVDARNQDSPPVLSHAGELKRAKHQFSTSE